MPKHARTDNSKPPRFDQEVEERKRQRAHGDAERAAADTDRAPQQEGDDEYPDALDSLVPDVDKEPLLFSSSEQQLAMVPADAWAADEKKGRKGKKHLTVHQKKSRRMRRVLIVVILLLVALIGALVYFSYMLFQETQKEAAQQTIQQVPHDVDELKDSDTTSDASTTPVKSTEVPLLTGLLGKTEDEAIKLIGRGATAVSSTPVNEENNPVRANVKVSLTDEPGDSRSGTPTVYLGLDEGGMVVTAGYSAATSSLGYGTLSFSDAVKNESIVEKTLAEAGLTLPEGTVVLPADKSEYSNYASDGTTLVKESYSFGGTIEQSGVVYEWSAVLRYDYTAANASGNLADTIRQIYVYVNTAGLDQSGDAVAEGSGEE